MLPRLMATLVAAAALLGVSAKATFPQYEDPFEGGPPLSLGGDNGCRVVLFEEVSLVSYGQVERARIDPAAACPGDWDRVVVELTGAVAGVQYDRAGALWFAGVELLRVTTPEPDSDGIRWQVRRDVSDYRAIFQASANATLAIPNTVDSTYTGALNMSGALHFSKANSGSDGPPPADAVFPLLDAASAANPWGAMTLNTWTNSTFKLPRRDAIRGTLEIFASGHACEEFWYTNVPDAYTNATGMCGGGPYREILVLIDGTVVGAALPPPVIYTGGICPLLWRPLTGIYSFSVPPHRFDLAPVLGLLNDGRPHEFSVTVVGAESSWFIDPSLFLTWAEPETSPGPVYSGGVVSSSSSARIHTVPKGSASTGWAFATDTVSSFTVTGTLVSPSNVTTTSRTSGEAVSSNLNIVGDVAGVTTGELLFTVRTDAGPNTKPAVSRRRFPYRVATTFVENADYMAIRGEVDYAVEAKEDGLSWRLAMATNATYNRSATGYVFYDMDDAAVETFDAAGCYSQRLAAFDGAVVERLVDDRCEEHVLGTLCSRYDACAAPQVVGPDRAAAAALPGERRRPRLPPPGRTYRRKQGY